MKYGEGLANQFRVRESLRPNELQQRIAEQIRVAAVVVLERHLVEVRGQVTVYA